MTAFIRSRNLRSAAEAALVLAVGMGFGRFAFTAILPHMVEEDVLSLGEGSLAASANYAGYLLGALLAVRARAHHAHCLCLWAVIGTAACLAALALSAPVPVIVMLRGLAGAHCETKELTPAAYWSTRPLLEASVFNKPVEQALTAYYQTDDSLRHVWTHGVKFRREIEKVPYLLIK